MVIVLRRFQDMPKDVPWLKFMIEYFREIGDFVSKTSYATIPAVIFNFLNKCILCIFLNKIKLNIFSLVKSSNVEEEGLILEAIDCLRSFTSFYHDDIPDLATSVPGTFYPVFALRSSALTAHRASSMSTHSICVCIKCFK